MATPLGNEIDRLNIAIRATYDTALRDGLGILKIYLEKNEGATLEDGIRFLEKTIEKKSYRTRGY